MRAVVNARTRSVSDRATAALLRETYLEPSSQSDPFVCDLNGIEQLSPDAADELVGKFVLRLRDQRPDAVVFIIGRTDDVLGKVHAALRDRRQAAWGINERESPNEWIALGDINDADREALSRFAQGARDDPAFEALVTKGLLRRGADGYTPPVLPEPEWEPVATASV